MPVHITLFRHLMPSLEAELRDRLARLAAAPPPRAHIAGVQDLGGGTALRVASDELEAMREELADALRGLLLPQDRAAWRPHVTVQNKVLRRDAIALQKTLQAGDFPRPLDLRGLALWRYLGGPWEPLRTWPFRG